MADNNNTTHRDNEISMLFPELLSNEGITALLRQRYVDVPEDIVEDRDQLMELFYNHVKPLPQRKYRSNRRGSEMTRKQILFSKKRKIPFSEELPSNSLKSEPDDNPLPRFMTSASISTDSTESVLPPKSMINFDRKVIKLNSGKGITCSGSMDSKSTVTSLSSTSSSSANSEVKSQSVKKRTSVCTEKAESAKPKKIRLNKVTMKTGEKEDTQNLKRGQSTIEDTVQIDSEDGGSPKKKIKRISWP